MKRTLTFIGLLSYLAILLCYYNMVYLLPVLFLLTFKCQKKYICLAMVVIVSVCISFWLRSNYFDSYQHQDNIEGYVKTFRGDHYIKVKDHKVLLKGEISPGYYRINSKVYQNTYRNPNTFDYTLYLKSQGFSHVIFVDQSQVEAIQIDEEKQVSFDSIYEPYYKSLLFADKSDLDSEVFQVNGTSHILAISGLHIGILYGIVYFLFRFSKHKTILSLLMVLVYIHLLDYPISALRAFGMIGMTIIATYTNRKYDVLQTLSLIALLFMLYNPFVVFNSGFQYSIVAVCIIEICFNGIFRKIDSKTLKLILLPIVIQLGMMPLMIYHQNQVHLLGFMSNIVSVFFIAWVIYGLLIYMIIPLPIVLEFVDFIFKLILDVNLYFYDMTWLSIELPSPPLILLIAFYLTVILLREKTIRRFLARMMSVLIVGLIVYNLTVVEISFLDIGQGDSVLVKRGFQSMLIDGGKPSDQNRLKDILYKQGVKHIDYVMVSHSDMDHIGGLIGLDDMLEEAVLIYNSPNETTEAFMDINCKTRLESSGQNFDLGFCTFSPLEYPIGESKNNASLIGYLNIYDTKLFLSGDIEAVIESQLILAPVDILKVPHHGSKTSSTEGFLKQLRPDVSVVCVGRNSYGHPHKEVIDRLRGLSQVFTTKPSCVKVYVFPLGIYFVKTFN